MENLSLYATLALQENLVPAVLFKFCFVLHYFGLRKRSLVFTSLFGVLFLVCSYIFRNWVFFAFFDEFLFVDDGPFGKIVIGIGVFLIIIGLIHFVDWIRLKLNKRPLIGFELFECKTRNPFGIMFRAFIQTVMVVLMAFFMSLFHFGSKLEYILFLEYSLYLQEGIFMLNADLIETFIYSHLIVLLLMMLLILGSFEKLVQKFPTYSKLFLTASCLCPGIGLLVYIL